MYYFFYWDIFHWVNVIIKFMIIFFLFTQAFIFQIYSQIAKSLQEKGLTGLSVLYYSKLTIYPSLILLMLSWDKHSFEYLMSNKHILFVFVGFLISSSIFQYVYFVSRHMVKALSFVSVVLNAIGLPAIVITSFLINKDVPSVYEIFGIFFLILALILKPSNGKTKNVSQLRYSVITIVAISIIYLLLQTIKDPLYREFMMNIPNTLFAVALYLTCSSIIINVFFFFKKKPSDIKLIDVDNKTRLYTYLIPTLLFVGSIPEAYSFANVPAFTVVAVSMVNMIMSLTSDIKNKRIIFNLRTALFIVFVLGGVSLNIFGRLH